MSGAPVFRLEVPIARDPAGVAHWWLDFPDAYEARDPREQPYRIETLSRTPERLEVITHWRMMGMRLRFPETIHILGPRAFDAEIRMGPVEVRDQFRVEDDGHGGTLMRIRTEARGHGMGGRVMARLAAPRLHRWMRRIWAHAAELCAEDGRRAAAQGSATSTRVSRAKSSEGSTSKRA